MTNRATNYNINLNQKGYFKNHLTWYGVISSWFLIGLVPIMPGTFGSLAAYPLYAICLMLTNHAGHAVMLIFLVAFCLLVLGLVSVELFQRYTKLYDHSSVVIDEVVGQLISSAICYFAFHSHTCALGDLFNIHSDVAIFVVSFMAFRYFDIKKPSIIGYIDRRSKSSLTVMADDVVAGIAAGGSIYLLCSFFNWF